MTCVHYTLQSLYRYRYITGTCYSMRSPRASSFDRVSRVCVRVNRLRARYRALCRGTGARALARAAAVATATVRPPRALARLSWRGGELQVGSEAL